MLAALGPEHHHTGTKSTRSAPVQRIRSRVTIIRLSISSAYQLSQLTIWGWSTDVDDEHRDKEGITESCYQKGHRGWESLRFLKQ